jgi:capsular exopolysaccharide synthesis family protein
MMIILGGFLGLFLGIGSAFFLEYMVNTIKTPDDVAQHLDLPVLGVVPRIAKAQRRQRTPIILQQDLPRSIPAESYRSLRTKLLFSKADCPRKTIVVTSTGPKEGKSTTTVNLGMALARAEQSVLLVDADLRRPVLHQVFGTDRNKGLSTVLAEELTIDEAIVDTGVPNLSLLAAGVLSENPSEILGAPRMKELTDQIRERYDIALFDSAPLLGMTDTVVLTTEADATVLVIKTGSPTRKALRIALAQLEQVGAEICGVVLNNVDIKRDRYYYHNYYYY